MSISFSPLLRCEGNDFESLVDDVTSNVSTDCTSCVPVQLTTWTTGSAQASWRETAARSLARLVSPQPWAPWWAPLFRPPRMPWMGCLQEGRWCGVSDTTHPAQPEPVRTDNLLCLTLTGTAAAHWQTPWAHTDQMLHSCKELGFQHTGCWHQACGVGCVVVIFFFFYISDFLLICTDACYKSGFVFPLCIGSVRAKHFLGIKSKINLFIWIWYVTIISNAGAIFGYTAEPLC